MTGQQPAELPQAETVPRWVEVALEPFLRYRKANLSSTVITQWRFESRYFSSLLLFSVSSAGQRAERFVAKFPKEARGRGFTVLPARVSADIELAAEEHNAFAALNRDWRDSETGYVAPRFYDPSSGMLVFDYVEGENLYQRTLPRRILFRQSLNDALPFLRKLGKGLATYHADTAIPSAIDATRWIGKIQSTARQLGTVLPNWLGTGGWSNRPGTIVRAIKGFELRNARVTDGRIWLFDPGRLREEPAEADVARFVASVRIAGWGTPFFAIPLDTAVLEAAFVEGYETKRKVDRTLLRLFMLRELLWNWREGRDAISSKGLPSFVGAPISRIYVDPPFRRLWVAETRLTAGFDQ